MSLEWPDFEAEQKKKLKAMRKKSAQHPIASDSDSDSEDDKSNKKRRKQGMLASHAVSEIVKLISPPSRIAFPSRCV